MSMYSYCMFVYFHRASWHSSATLTEVFPYFFLSCKANARIKLAKMVHHVLCIVCFASFCVLFVCKCVLYCCHPTAVNKYIISYCIISYCIISYHIISHHIISYIISYHISNHIISYHISYHTISYIR